MKFHWLVLIWMLGGLVFGLLLQQLTEEKPWDGATWKSAPAGIELARVDGSGPAKKLPVGEVVTAVILNGGSTSAERPEQRLPVASPADYAAVLERTRNGDVLWLEFEPAEGSTQPRIRLITLQLDPDCQRARWIAPFGFVADIFMALLKMLIVPIILTSIISGVAGVGSMSDLRRLGIKTFAYYIVTSMLAICLGQLLVSIIRPGDGAELGLAALESEDGTSATGFVDVLKRMVPENVFAAMSENGQMLQVIFFALVFGFFITRAARPHRERLTELVNSLFQVMLRMAEGILKLLPYGVFCLLVRVVAKTGFAVFEPLLLYMFTVALALVLHACVTLPLILKFVGRLSPLRWFKAMSPAIMTAFSTSSSSMTLPVTLETVEKRGRVSNRVTSFTLPLGATINMDGTALYECIGVIFLAQYYAGVSGFELTVGAQGLVVLMALLASIGAAGIPSAGLVMMTAILTALGLPVEGAGLLLAVDRPLDMMRTVVNVWSDSCGAAVIARSEGEEGPLHAGSPA